MSGFAARQFEFDVATCGDRLVGAPHFGGNEMIYGDTTSIVDMLTAERIG